MKVIPAHSAREIADQYDYVNYTITEAALRGSHCCYIKMLNAASAKYTLAELIKLGYKGHVMTDIVENGIYIEWL